MVQLITAENKAELECEIRSMYEARRRVFVDLLKWDIAVTPDGLELDEFDRDGAVYLLISQSNGSHMGSMRLLPTNHNHILGKFFSDLCEHSVPTGPSIFEITRLCLCPTLRTPVRFQIRNRLISAMVDYALTNGIDAFTGVVNAQFLSEILQMGWRCTALGPSRVINGASISAFRIDIDKATPERLRMTGIYIPRSISPTEIAAP